MSKQPIRELKAMNDIIKKFIEEKKLDFEGYKMLIKDFCPENARILSEEARKVREAAYGKKVYIRGLIEISNICKNDCYYCGIRKSNRNCERYRLSEDEILSCCENGYRLGFRTFVLQGGEDGYFTVPVLTSLITKIKSRYPECAVTLSLGEKTKNEYQSLFDAGADRYLLRHETADDGHYSCLHPAPLTLADRKKCLYDLKSIGFQTGCGFMTGSPGQSADTLAKDLKFIEEFNPEMCGIGPFIPHKDTPFGKEKAGSVDFTCYLLSIIRIMHPHILLPATTALGTLEKNGREKGILAGANVIMPNLSPEEAKNRYMLYNNKLSTGAESAEMIELLKEQIKNIGYEIVCHRGDAERNNYGSL